jgi:hypothetical protein
MLLTDPRRNVISNPVLVGHQRIEVVITVELPELDFFLESRGILKVACVAEVCGELPPDLAVLRVEDEPFDHSAEHWVAPEGLP